MAAKYTTIFPIRHNFIGHEYPSVAQEQVIETVKVHAFVLFFDQKGRCLTGNLD